MFILLNERFYMNAGKGGLKRDFINTSIPLRLSSFKMEFLLILGVHITLVYPDLFLFLRIGVNVEFGLWFDG